MRSYAELELVARNIVEGEAERLAAGRAPPWLAGGTPA